MIIAVETVITPRFVELAADRPAMLARVEGQRQIIDALNSQEESLAHYTSYLGRAYQRASEYSRLAAQPHLSWGWKKDAMEIWQVLGRDKAHFLLELQCVQLMLQMERLDDALDKSANLLERAQNEAQFSPYLIFAHEVRGCVLGAIDLYDRAHEHFLQMRSTLSSSLLEDRVDRWIEFCEKMKQA